LRKETEKKSYESEFSIFEKSSNKFGIFDFWGTEKMGRKWASFTP